MRTARLAFVLLLAFAGRSAADPASDAAAEKVKKLNKETATLEAADAKLKEIVKDKKTAAELVKAGEAMLKSAKGEEKPIRFYAGLVLGKAAENVKNYAAAERFYAFCTDNAITDLQSGKLIVTAAENQLEFYAARKKYKEMEELCDKLLVIEGDKTLNNAKIYFMEQQIKAVAKQGDVDKALEKADKLAKLFEGEWYILQIKGWVQREAGKYEAAIKTYEDVIDKIENADNPQFKKEDRQRYVRNTKYVISGILLENDQLDKATDVLQELIKGDPENATFYNDLGFLWSDHDLKLAESEKLIRKAIELDLKAKKKALDEGKIDADVAKKTNSAYADSLGWVLYKQKKYAEALPHLQDAAGADDEESNHIEIWDHLGDCQLALGKKKEALETFQKALKMEDVTKKDGERRKKVTEKVKKLKAEMK